MKQRPSPEAGSNAPCSLPELKPADLEWSQLVDFRVKVREQLQEGIYPHVQPRPLSNPREWMQIRADIADLFGLDQDDFSVSDAMESFQRHFPVEFRPNRALSQVFCPSGLQLLHADDMVPLRISLLRVDMAGSCKPRYLRFDHGWDIGQGSDAVNTVEQVVEIDLEEPQYITRSDELHGMAFYFDPGIEQDLMQNLLMDVSSELFDHEDFIPGSGLSLITTMAGSTVVRVKLPNGLFVWYRCDEWLLQERRRRR